MSHGLATMETEIRCPYCGEPIACWVDESGGRSQRYVEDCAVCCQPMEVVVRLHEQETPSVDVRRLDE